MGAGIAALCAQADIPVVLLDITKESADKAVERMLLGRFPAIEEPTKSRVDHYWRVAGRAASAEDV